MNKNAFNKLSYGVYVISTWDNGRPTGCIANSAMQITSDPATVAVSINHNNFTNKCMQDTGRFAISILGESANPGIIGSFGYKSGKDFDKFDEVESEIKGFMPIIKEACAYITCEIIEKFETNTHTIFLGKILEADVMKQEEAMTYAYYHNVIKGKSPKNAPTYIGD